MRATISGGRLFHRTSHVAALMRPQLIEAWRRPARCGKGIKCTVALFGITMARIALGYWSPRYFFVLGYPLLVLLTSSHELIAQKFNKWWLRASKSRRVLMRFDRNLLGRRDRILIHTLPLSARRRALILSVITSSTLNSTQDTGR